MAVQADVIYFDLSFTSIISFFIKNFLNVNIIFLILPLIGLSVNAQTNSNEINENEINSDFPGLLKPIDLDNSSIKDVDMWAKDWAGGLLSKAEIVEYCDGVDGMYEEVYRLKWLKHA